MVVKLSVIVSDDDVEKSKLTNDRFLEEAFDFAAGNVCKGFYLHPFDEVVDHNSKEFLLTNCRKKWIEYVHPPLG